jgi:3-oxoacyl-[acyl-carrier-protein] synthase-3
MPHFAKIQDVSVHFPDGILSNQELASLYPDWPAEKILDKTGIRERRIASQEETASDLAFKAALKLFDQGQIKKEEVDFIILCTQAPDFILPTSACILQSKLGLSKSCGAFDINLGCSGYVYGLSVAKGLIETGAAKCVLLLTADTYTKYIHPMDKSVRTIFGDGATASAVVASKNDTPLIDSFVFGTDGNGAQDLIVPAGLFRMPKSNSTALETTDAAGNIRTSENLFMNGAGVMSFSLTAVPKALEDIFSKSNTTADDFDFFVLHQANKFMLESLRKKMKLPTEKFPIEIEFTGNTVSSTIPIVLHNMRNDGRLKSGQKLVLIGFGVGYSWAACVIHWI